MEQNVPIRKQGVSAALAAAQTQAVVAAAVRVPAEDGGRSLAEMAQRDLDAALQLLADRAQYITGASGAAIALRRDGRDDMLCRASVGSNAPELGALLSSQVGLSGESVRTRQLMRCDDAERDGRVNHEVCRRMGIASVLVMPVVNDDQVLGVFELFSGKTNAFSERDLSAIQRLSEMVETAVRLAQASENLPEQLTARERSVAEALHPEVFEGQFLGDLVVEESKQKRNGEAPVTPVSESAASAPVPLAATGEKPSLPAPTSVAPAKQGTDPVSGHFQAASELSSAAKKPMFWSADWAQEAEPGDTGDADESHVPPMLRGLRKCEACGFPISGGRVLCVECEEKKWRGQLRPQAGERKASAGPARVPESKSGSPSFAGAAPSMAKAPASAPTQSATQSDASPMTPPASSHSEPPRPEAATEANLQNKIAAPEFHLSAELESSQPWFAANKYVVIVLLAIAIAAAAFFLLR